MARTHQAWRFVKHNDVTIICHEMKIDVSMDWDIPNIYADNGMTKDIIRGVWSYAAVPRLPVFIKHVYLVQPSDRRLKF
jgi:hypothetical protein